MRRSLFCLLVCTILVLPARAGDAEAPAWVEPMRKVHARFKGEKGTLALFGDSITRSLAFWAGLPNAHKNMSKQTEADFKLVDAHLRKECWRDWRGPAFGNEG